MLADGNPFRARGFEYDCARADVDHRLTKPKHPWITRQVERVNRTIKAAIVKRYLCETHADLRTHLADFVTASNFARELITLKGLNPYEFIGKLRTKEPERFMLDPLHRMPGPNI